MSSRIRLHGYDILSEVSLRSKTYVYKTRPKLHEDVPQYMDAEERSCVSVCVRWSTGSSLRRHRGTSLL